MASRNRPRGAFVKDDASDAHEERNMWSQIVTDIKRLRATHARAAEVAKAQVELEAKMGKSPTVKEIDDLAALYREGVKLAEEEEKILKEEPNDVIKNIEILAALRSASETEPVRPPQAVSKPRNPKRQKLETDGAADLPAAPVMSPSVVLPGPAARVKQTGTVRAVSVPAIREVKPEPGVKVEEGSEGSKGPAGEKAGKFFVGAEVAYKQVRPKEDGSQWIQCNITSISELGGKKRYEVQDPEPDENGQPGQVFSKISAAALIAIPKEGDALVDFPVGKLVLARYPETTTFYRATIAGSKKDVYRLKFEDDQGQEMEVYRRFVLDVSSK